MVYTHHITNVKKNGLYERIVHIQKEKSQKETSKDLKKEIEALSMNEMCEYLDKHH